MSTEPSEADEGDNHEIHRALEEAMEWIAYWQGRCEASEAEAADRIMSLEDEVGYLTQIICEERGLLVQLLLEKQAKLEN